MLEYQFKLLFVYLFQKSLSKKLKVHCKEFILKNRKELKKFKINQIKMNK
jgi:hypothetical protein